MDETHQRAYDDDRSASSRSASRAVALSHSGSGRPAGQCVLLRQSSVSGAGASIVDLANADFTKASWVKATGVHMSIMTQRNGDSTWEKGEKGFYLERAGVRNFVGFGNSYIHGTTAVNDGAGMDVPAIRHVPI